MRAGKKSRRELMPAGEEGEGRECWVVVKGKGLKVGGRWGCLGGGGGRERIEEGRGGEG